MNAHKIIHDKVTFIREFPLKDGRIAQLKQTLGKEPEFDVLIKKFNPQTQQYIYKNVSEWQNGLNKLVETLQTYLTPNINKNTLKYTDKITLKINERETMIFLKNYFYDTVKVIRKTKDSSGKLIQKDVAVCSPPMGIENLRPSKAQLDDYMNAALNPLDFYRTRFLKGKPQELERTIRRSYALKKIKEGDIYLNRALNIEKLVNAQNEGGISSTFYLNYYKNGIPLLTNNKLL